ARHQGTIEVLREHANLLDLTHDTIFVRTHDDVITSWNRAATELYGWRREQAVGRKAAELLKTEFPMPFDAIMSEVARTGRWEGELVHTTLDGRRERAVGGKAAELLKTEFPMPFDAIMSEVARTGRWEGELVHTTLDGRRVTGASRWAVQRGR